MAVFGSELDHTTFDVRLIKGPLEYVPVAENCIYEPTTKLSSDAGVTLIDIRIGVGVVVVGVTDGGLVIEGFAQDAKAQRESIIADASNIKTFKRANDIIARLPVTFFLFRNFSLYVGVF